MVAPLNITSLYEAQPLGFFEKLVSSVFETLIFRKVVL